MSTNLITYLNFMANWESQSDADVQKVIDEQRLFVQLGDFESDSIVDDEFKTLIDLATVVRDETVEADVEHIAADVAAVAAFWSFGLGMAAFVYLQANEMLLRADISKKSGGLNTKLKTVDTDIASKISSKVYDYVKKYKANNDVIKAQDPKGVGLREARSNLMQFMSHVDRRYKGKGGLTVKNFKQLAASARLAYNSKEIDKVYDALDELNLSKKSQADVAKLVNTLKGLNFTHKNILTLIQGLSFAIAFHKMSIAKNTIEECAKAAGLPVEEVESSAFGMMDACGKFTAGVAIVMSVFDVYLSILDIEDIVEQTKKMVDELNDTIKPNYKSFFNGIKESAKAYNEAISEASTQSE